MLPKTVLSKEGDHPLSEVLKRLDALNLDLYDAFEIDLATARTDTPYWIAGDTFTVESLDGTASVRLHDISKPLVSLNRLRKLTSPFGRFFLTNAAQAGKTLKFTVGRDASFDASPLISTHVADVAGVDINPAEAATAPTLYNTTMTLADTEYSQLLPVGTKKFLVKTRDGTAFRIAFVTGKVAALTAPYLSVSANTPYSEDNLKLPTVTMYFGCAVAAKVVELLCWS